MATFLANEINTTGGDTGPIARVKINFPLKYKILQGVC